MPDSLADVIYRVPGDNNNRDRAEQTAAAVRAHIAAVLDAEVEAWASDVKSKVGHSFYRGQGAAAAIDRLRATLLASEDSDG